MTQDQPTRIQQPISQDNAMPPVSPSYPNVKARPQRSTQAFANSSRQERSRKPSGGLPLQTTPSAPSRISPLGVWGKRALIIWSLIGAAALVYFLGIALSILSMPVGILIWTVLFVFLLEWQVDALERRGIKRIWGTMVAYAGMFVVLFVVGALMFSPLFNVGEQFENLIKGLPGFVEQVVGFVNSLSSRFADMLNNPAVSDVMSSAQRALISVASGIAGNSLGGVIDIGQLTMNTFLCVGFALVVSFWLILEMPGLMRETQRLVPPKYRADADFLYQTVTRAFGGYVRATGLQCLIIAFGCTIGFTVIGVPNSIAIGIIAGLLNVIPVVGPWLGGAVAALAAVFDSPLVALLALVVAVVIQQAVYTFISPKIMADSVDVHPAIVILSLMVGYAIGMQMSGLVGGLVGMFLAIPFAAILKAMFVHYFEKRTGRRLVSPDGVFFKGNPRSTKSDSPHQGLGSNDTRAHTSRPARTGRPSNSTQTGQTSGPARQEKTRAKERR